MNKAEVIDIVYDAIEGVKIQIYKEIDEILEITLQKLEGVISDNSLYIELFKLKNKIENYLEDLEAR
ncbi:MAG: hypothetical protein ACTSRP_09145 [Candidatus Helarchaeota archaeon]